MHSQASLATQQAYTAVRGGEPGCPDMLVLPVQLEDHLMAANGGPAENRLIGGLTPLDQNRLKELNRMVEPESRLSPKVAVMKPILRFLQVRHDVLD